MTNEAQIMQIRLRINDKYRNRMSFLPRSYSITHSDDLKVSDRGPDNVLGLCIHDCAITTFLLKLMSKLSNIMRGWLL